MSDRYFNYQAALRSGSQADPVVVQPGAKITRQRGIEEANARPRNERARRPVIHSDRENIIVVTGAVLDSVGRFRMSMQAGPEVERLPGCAMNSIEDRTRWDDVRGKGACIKVCGRNWGQRWKG